MKITYDTPNRIQETITISIGTVVIYTGGMYGDSYRNPLWGGTQGQVFGEIVNFDGQIHDCLLVYVKWSNGSTNDYMVDQLTYIETHNGKVKCIYSGKLNTIVIPDYGSIKPEYAPIKKPEPALVLDENRMKGLFNI